MPIDVSYLLGWLYHLGENNPASVNLRVMINI